MFSSSELDTNILALLAMLFSGSADAPEV